MIPGIVLKTVCIICGLLTIVRGICIWWKAHNSKYNRDMLYHDIQNLDEVARAVESNAIISITQMHLRLED